ncbi:hypothetical protein AHAS_Ahas03G0114200 [Arachis hypogaea]
MKAIEFNSKHINTMNVYHFDRSARRRQVYRLEFCPIGHEDDWPSYDGLAIRPNPRMMRVKKGQPVSFRIRNNMDDVVHTG